MKTYITYIPFLSALTLSSPTDEKVSSELQASSDTSVDNKSFLFNGNNGNNGNNRGNRGNNYRQRCPFFNGSTGSSVDGKSLLSSGKSCPFLKRYKSAGQQQPQPQLQFDPQPQEPQQIPKRQQQQHQKQQQQ
ncbi:hypothetical protein K502DRAFT_330348 [Neoconidiobolus thromboides FSU 785]|nr:hypothetical protein K502DRAFT_330348 [Neoconidiobolus thromboides FSU 785]